jgi:hypothetical protein
MRHRVPPTHRWKPRPVFKRFLDRMNHMVLEIPTDAERRDAIDAMFECYPASTETELALLWESQKILDESDAAGIFTGDEDNA